MSNAAVGTVIIIVVMIIVFGATFAWMYSVDLLFLPDFVENILGIGDDEGIPSFVTGELSEIVRNGKNQRGETVVFEDTFDNLRAALLSESAADGIYLCADISYYDDVEPTVRRVKYYRDGDRFRVEIYAPGDNDTQELLKIADSDNITIIDKATGESRTVARGSDILPENEAMIPSVYDLLNAVEAFYETEDVINGVTVNGSTHSELSECVIKLVDYDDQKLYYVSFVYNDLGIREEYFVSLDNCIIISLNTFYGDKLVYSYEAVTISTKENDFCEDVLYLVSKAQ